MLAIRRESDEFGRMDRSIVQLRPQAGSAPRPVAAGQRSAPPEIEDAIQLVAKVSAVLDDMVRQKQAVEAAASKCVARYKTDASAARAQLEECRIEIEVLRQESDAVCQKAEARTHDLEQKLAESRQQLAATRQELETANQWLGQFHTQMTELLSGVPSLLEDRQGGLQG